MPRPPSSGQRFTDSHDVTTANSTLNTFMRGKQKSWMTNIGPPTQPSPRPPRPTHQPVDIPPPPPPAAHIRPPVPQQVGRSSQQLSPAIPPNLLPSPAPSDEPSPSLSNPTDSPAIRSRVLGQPQQKQPSCANPPAPQQLFSPDVREQVAVVAEASAPVPATEADPSANMQAVGALPPLSSAQSPTAMAPPRLPGPSQTDQALIAPSSAASIDLTDSAQSSPISAGRPPSKRRRVDTTTVPDTPWRTTQLAQHIDRRLEYVGGSQIANRTELPRFLLLKDACLKNDHFYLHFHSLYCTWSINPAGLPPMPGHDMNTIHQGFRVLTSVLKSNDRFSPQNLMWCVNFPDPEFNSRQPTMVAIIARFLTSVSLNLSALEQKIVSRGWPYLVHELLDTLHCRSVIMQTILFTACRRRLGLVDGSDLGSQAQQIFENDQRHHLDERGQFRQSDEPIGNWNQNLVIGYRQLMNIQEERQSLVRQSQKAQQEPQQQLLYAQNGVTNSIQNQNLVAPQVPQNNVHYATSQIATAAASQTRRAAFNPMLPMIDPPIQNLTWPQHTPDSHSTAGTPPVANASLVPQDSARPFQTVPPTFVLQSSSTMMNPSVPSALMQRTANQQLQAQVVSRPPQYYNELNPQEQVFHDQWQMQQQMQPQQHRRQMQLTQQQRFQLRQRRHHQQRLQPQQQQQMPRGDSQQQWSQAMNAPSVQYLLASQALVPGPPQPLTGRYPQVSGHLLNQWAPQVTGVMPQQQRNQQAAPARFNNAGLVVSQAALLVPRSGQLIDRSQYPHSHQEKKSLLMALHQVDARSPERTRCLSDPDERFYQSVQSFAIAPFQLAYLHQLDIEITSEQYSRLCRRMKLPNLGGNVMTTTVREYTSGLLRLRARCCRLLSEKSIAAAEWVTKESLWPEHIYIRFNEKSIQIRRGTHNGKDLPVELTDFVQPGVNRLQVVTSSKGPTATDKRGKLFFMAVEIVETASHSDILRNVQTNGRIGREVTLGKIQARVNCVPDEDGLTIIDRTGDTTQELSVDLTDPFSARIFEVPARGASCTHMECFDLETWLSTRPVKQQMKCGHRDVCTCPKHLQPSEPDKWKCPICFGDARPGSLRVDSFLEDVRKKLQNENKLDTKSILVRADGTWHPVMEPAGDDDDSDGGGFPAPQNIGATICNRLSKSISVERAPVEIIELD